MRYGIRKKGFTLMMAVLVAGILLAIGLAIFNITIKELQISSSGRDSQFAFYAADSGIECALYWDQKQDSFASSTPSTIVCNGVGIPNMGGKDYGEASTFSYEVDGLCSVVSVTKNETHPRTVMEAKGYNTSCESTTSSRRLERAIRVTF